MRHGFFWSVILCLSSSSSSFAEGMHELNINKFRTDASWAKHIADHSLYSDLEVLARDGNVRPSLLFEENGTLLTIKGKASPTEQRVNSHASCIYIGGMIWLLDYSPISPVQVRMQTWSVDADGEHDWKGVDLPAVHQGDSSQYFKSLCMKEALVLREGKKESI